MSCLPCPQGEYPQFGHVGMVAEALSGDPEGEITALDDDQARERLGGGNSRERAAGAGYIEVAGFGGNAVCIRKLPRAGARKWWLWRRRVPRVATGCWARAVIVPWWLG